MDKRFIIDHEQLQLDKNAGWTLIGISEKPNGTLSDHEYFCIHDDIFDRIQSTHQKINIMWRFISNEQNENEFQGESSEINYEKIQNKKRSITKKTTKHTLQRKSKKS